MTTKRVFTWARENCPESWCGGLLYPKISHYHCAVGKHGAALAHGHKQWEQACSVEGPGPAWTGIMRKDSC